VKEKRGKSFIALGQKREKKNKKKELVLGPYEGRAERAKKTTQVRQPAAKVGDKLIL